jgi:hypothetical protein
MTEIIMFLFYGVAFYFVIRCIAADYDDQKSFWINAVLAVTFWIIGFLTFILFK